MYNQTLDLFTRLVLGSLADLVMEIQLPTQQEYLIMFPLSKMQLQLIATLRLTQL